MTDTNSFQSDTPLGVGNIISESFSILFGNLVKILILGFIGAFIGFLINGLLTGFDFALGLSDDLANTSTASFVLGTLINIVVYGFITALLVQLAYDAKLGRSRPMGDYFGPAMASAVPIAILSIVISILTGIGALALIVGALWVYAVFSATFPAVVIENAGFTAMGRSADLTKNYRWPIVGAMIVVWLVIIAIQIAGGFVILLIASVIGTGFVSLIILGILFSLMGAFGYGLGGIVMSLIYARLREIKEGVSVDEIAKVFE